MTEEQRAVLEKFGFRIEAQEVKHSKLGIVRGIEEFAGMKSAEELQQYVKDLLRNQCLWKREHGGRS